jgi:hypothetical protein
MRLVKKNPVFFAVCALLSFVFLGGGALVFLESSKISTSKQQVSIAQGRLDRLLLLEPAATDENVAVSKQNAELLSAQLKRICEDLQPGSGFELSNDGVRVMSGIQQYISDFQELVTVDPDSKPEVIGIEVADNFAFGFQKYLDEAIIPEDETVVPILDKQRQVLTYIVQQLIAAQPVGIQKIEREMYELVAADGKPTAGFQINPAVSARVPDAINTLAFRVTFNGYTRSLRHFLNNLAQFQMPIVVRSVEVRRPLPKTVSAGKKKRRQESVDDIFSAFSGSSTPVKAEVKPAESQTPVISDNVSSFTVTLEFIEIILPFDFEEDPA